MNKNKVMLNKDAERAFFRIGDETLEQVQEYNYLGQMVKADPNNEKEIRCTIGLGWGAFGKQIRYLYP